MTAKQESNLDGHIAAIRQCHKEVESHGVSLVESFNDYVDIVGLSDLEVEFLADELGIEL